MSRKCADRTIKEEVLMLGRRKKPLTYEAMVKQIRARHPDAQTSVKTVQWYVSRLRKEGEEVHIKDGRSMPRLQVS